MTKKIITLLVAGVLIVGGVSVAILVQHKNQLTTVQQVKNNNILVEKKVTSPVASWKSYSDGTYGFSINYPSDWPAEKRPITWHTPTDPINISFGKGYGEISPGNLDLYTYKGRNLSYLPEIKKYDYKPSGCTQTDAVINSERAIKLTCEGGFVAYAVSDTKNLFFLEYVMTSDEKDATREKMIESFKFIQPTVTRKESLYLNPNFGFKMQLPVEFSDYKTKITPLSPAQTRISFFLPTSDTSFKETFPEEAIPGYAEFFLIDAMRVNDWKKFLVDCNKKMEIGCITETDLIGKNQQFVFQVGISGTPPKDVAKRVESKITFKYLKDNFSANISK